MGSCYSLVSDCELADGLLELAILATNRQGEHNLSGKLLISCPVSTTVRVSPQVGQQ